MTDVHLSPPEARAIATIAESLATIADRLDRLVTGIEKVDGAKNIVAALAVVNGTLQDLVVATGGQEPHYTIKGGGIAFDGLEDVPEQ
jgi:hypothetical protein